MKHIEIPAGIVITILGIFIALQGEEIFYLVLVIGWFLIVDGIESHYGSKSFLQLHTNKFMAMLILGALVGAAIDFFNIFLNNALWSYNNPNWIAIVASYGLTLPTAYKTHHLINRFIKVKVNNKKIFLIQNKKYHLFVIGIILLTAAYFTKNIPVISFGFFLTGFMIFLESIILLLKKQSLLEEIIKNPKIIWSIIIQAFGSAIIVEVANLPVDSWIYHVLDYQIFGLYPIIMVGWIPLIYLYLSTYRLTR